VNLRKAMTGFSSLLGSAVGNMTWGEIGIYGRSAHGIMCRALQHSLGTA
jgi:hypothetical protein